MNKKQLILNTPLRGLPAGAIVVVLFENDVALDPYWRARIQDARRDNCVEIVVVKPHRETKVDTPPENKSPEKPPNESIKTKG